MPKHERTEEFKSLGVEVWIDLGNASTEEVRDLFDSLAELHRAFGGIGITIRDEPIRVFDVDKEEA